MASVNKLLPFYRGRDTKADHNNFAAGCSPVGALRFFAGEMMMKKAKTAVLRQKILVFQQKGSGAKKIAGIEAYAPGRFAVEVFSIDQPLPALVDEPEDYLPKRLDADLVLDFLRHPDLSAELKKRCQSEAVPLVASSKKYQVAPLLAAPPI